MDYTSEIGLEKFLVNELMKPPFNLDFTVASFSNLTCSEVIELLLMILAEIDPDRNNHDFSNEDDYTIISNILDFLQILRYNPPNSDSNYLGQRILMGDVDFLVPVMAWLLAKQDELKVRAYLAKFLVKIPLPEEDDWILDDEVVITYNKYEELLEEFKCVHKEYSKHQVTTNDPQIVVQETRGMEHDIQCIQNKIDGIKCRINNENPTGLEMKDLIHAYRISTLKIQELINDEKKEQQLCKELEQQRLRFENLYLEESQQNYGLGTTGQELLHKAMEENQRHKFLVYEKLPQEYKIFKRRIHALQTIDENPPISQSDINYLKNKVSHIQEEIKALDLRKHVKNSSQELFVLRQKSTTLQNKKMKLVADLNPILQRISIIKSHSQQIFVQKSEKARQLARNEEEFQTFVQLVQDKHNLCNEMKAEICRMKKEVGVLSATRFIIDSDWRESTRELGEIESRLGLTELYEDDLDKIEGIALQSCSGLPGTVGSGNEEIEKKRQHLLELSSNIRQLVDKIRSKKESLDSLVDAAGYEKQKEAILRMEYDSKKESYESKCSSYETGNKKLQLSIDTRKKQWEDNQFQLVQLKCLYAQLNVTKFRVTEEKVSRSLSFHGFREKLRVKILEQERIKKNLEEDQTQLEEYKSFSTKQRQLWTDLISLLQFKLQRAAARHIEAGDGDGDYCADFY